MEGPLEHIESAIAESTKARNAVLRGTSVQVRSDDERTKLKSVAYAWFRSHRPHIPNVELEEVDAAYTSVLASTDKASTRLTYGRLLKEAKDGLIGVRGHVTTTLSSLKAIHDSGAFKPDPPPDFAKLTADPAMRDILNRRWAEIQNCISADANLAATVMMGGLIESLLLARINAMNDQSAAFKANTAPRDKKTGNPCSLRDWTLVHMVEVAHELVWITKSAKDVGNVLRDFRNYIHPHKEHTDGVLITNDDARMFWEVCKSISRQVLA